MEGASSKRRLASPTPTCVSNDSMPETLKFTEGDSSKYQQMHKSHLQKKFQCLVEGIPQQGDTRLLHEIYTELYITEGGRGKVNYQHEIRQIERASWRDKAQGRPIKCSEIFKHIIEDKKKGKKEERVRGKKAEKDFTDQTPTATVLTKGVAGIGKTVSVQKFILDWAERKANQDVHFIFPLPFRELNMMKEKKFSLVDLIQHFFPEIKDLRVFTSSKHRVMFIFDGLDECRLPLDFHSNRKCCNVTEPASVDVLLTNLIKGNLLPSALLWITTRPAAANQIPPKYVSQVTEIRGFNNPQKEEYFRKRISDKNLANRVITHLKSCRSLHIMCHIPVFCWISATVVERTSKESEKVEMPRTLTQMYTRFLIIQTRIKKEKYTERKERDEEVIFKLGMLAFQQLEKANLIFYEEDLRQCGIDVTEASVYSGVCTQIFREESGLSQGKVFSFVHLSIQEFLAALYVFLCFNNRQRNMPDQQQSSQLSALFRAATLHDLHKTAVDLALQSKNGHLDLFLRFLLGLSLESNQTLLRPLLPQSSRQSQSSEQTAQYVKQKIRDQSSSDRRINLFYGLNELNHHAVVEVIKRSSGTLYVDILSPGEWKTKRFVFKMSEEQLAEFDLQRYIKTPEKDQIELLSPDEVLQRLVPVVTTCTSAQLRSCNLTEKSCSYLVSVLTSHSSSLRLLDLNNNKLLLDSGVELLCSGLRHQNCKLEELRLKFSNLTEKSCSYLASALNSHSSRLRVLHLSQNYLLGDSGVELLCSGFHNHNCKLEELRLSNCNLTGKSCSYLFSALISSSVRVLDLKVNELISASDVEQLSVLVKDPHCKLEKLEVNGHTFRKERPSAVASSSSISHSSSDAAGLQSVDIPQEDLRTDDQQKSCSSCTEVPDSSHWVLVKPEVSSEKRVSTYSLSSPAGSYECSVSRLRWSCAGPVSLQYRFTDWNVYAEQLAHMQIRPAGPLMDIKLMSGELEEIHLPHFLCLGDSEASVRDAVRVLHGQDSGVCVEECKLTRHHARLLHPSFSLFGVVYYLRRLLSPRIHCELLLFCTRTAPLNLHVYLLPNDPAHIMTIHEKKKHKGVWIEKPGAVGPLPLEARVRVTTSCQSQIQPQRMNLQPVSTSNFCEIYMRQPEEEFDMEVFSSEDTEPIWRVQIRREDYQQSSRMPRQVGSQVAAAFVDQHRAEIISRVREVMPIADRLLSQRVISHESYSTISAAPTSQARMRALYESLHSAGAQGKLAFYTFLQEQERLLVEDLWTT